MLLDSGTLRVCILENVADKGEMPKEKLRAKSEHYYGERTVGYGRQYAAKGVNERIDMLVRIWQDRTVRIDMYALLDNGEQYKIDNVQHLLDDDGLRVTDMTLRRLGDLYDVEREAESL